MSAKLPSRQASPRHHPERGLGLDTSRHVRLNILARAATSRESQNSTAGVI